MVRMCCATGDVALLAITGTTKLVPYHIVRSLQLIWGSGLCYSFGQGIPDSKVHGANMGPTWVLSVPDGPHIGLKNLAIRDIIERSHKVLKPQDLYLELYNHSDIWQTPQQHCCWCACQISKWCNNSNFQSYGFEASQDHTIRRLTRYWNKLIVITLVGDLSRAKWNFKKFEVL